MKKKVSKKENINKTQNKKVKKINRNKNKLNKSNEQIIDICKVLEKCDIEEISEYLTKQGKNKKFPDITARE